MARSSDLRAARVELLGVMAGISRLSDDPVSLSLDGQILDLGCVVERQHDELRSVGADVLVGGECEGDAEGAVRVRALTDDS